MAEVNNQSIISRFIGKEIGNIKITEYIGEGSMGIVYKGHHSNLDIDVAVKIIKDELLASKADEYLARFEREARIAAKLNHRCITRIIDYGILEERPYIVIEYIDGFTLSDFVKAHEENLNEFNVLKLIGMTASALFEAHNNNIIHRDLKPQNIMISKQGRPYITDLGLARNITDMTLTHTSVVMGSPAYMAPENFTSDEKIDLRSDIYSLGCVSYFTAFKQSPVKGKSMQDIMHKHVVGNINYNLPTDCSDITIDIIKKMMSPKIEERFQSAQEVVDSIKNAIKEIQARNNNLAENKSAVSSQEYYTETVEARQSGIFSATDSLTGSDAFLKVDQVLRVLEQRLGPTVSSHGSIRVTHATIKDRLILWILLISLLACSVVGYLYAS